MNRPFPRLLPGAAATMVMARARGIKIRVDEETLKVKAGPMAKIDEEFTSALRAHRDEVVKMYLYTQAILYLENECMYMGPQAAMDTYEEKFAEFTRKHLDPIMLDTDPANFLEVLRPGVGAAYRAALQAARRERRARKKKLATGDTGVQPPSRIPGESKKGKRERELAARGTPVWLQGSLDG